MWNLIRVRLWRERRAIGVLLLGMCLVTGFLALGPMTVTSIAAAEFEQRVNNASANELTVSLTNDTPYIGDVQTTTRETLAPFVQAVRTYRAVDGFKCGLLYEEGVPFDELNGSNATECYRPYTYPNIDELFEVVEGRMPQVIPPDSDSFVQVEALMTVEMAEEARTGLNDIFIMGGGDDVIVAQVVGLTEPRLPASDPFWTSRAQSVLEIFITALSAIDTRADMSPVVLPEVFEEVFADRYEVTYGLVGELSSEQIDSSIVNQLSAQLRELQDRVTLDNPQVSFRTPVSDFIADYQQSIAEAQGPIVLLSCLVLVLMLYNLVTITSLILEGQAVEWANFASRGGSVGQLVRIQFITTLLLAVVAFVLGPFIAYGILLLLSVVGPQAAILAPRFIQPVNLLSIGLSGVASLAIVGVLLIPAWQAANTSALRIERSISRPPSQPLWARFGLDWVLLGLGAAFLLRLYDLSTEAGIRGLVDDPASLLTVISQQTGNALDDPFSLAGPALLLTGAALLWMRFFPTLIRAIGTLLGRGDGLTVRLAFWNVERDPAHYAQLVLLLIGTLALGTASLTLSQTREVGAWETAQVQVGTDAVVSLNPRLADRNTDWTTFPSVTQTADLLVVPIGAEGDGALVGVAPEQITPFIDEATATTLTALGETTNRIAGGAPLPADAEELRLDVFPTAPDSDATLTTGFDVVLRDSLGFERVVTLTADDPTITGEWLTFGTSLDDVGIPPYTLTQLIFQTTLDGSSDFEHVVYLDNLRTTNANGTSETVNSFTEDTRQLWAWAGTISRRQISEGTALQVTDERQTEGDTSMSVRYRMRQVGVLIPPVPLIYNQQEQPTLQGVVSPVFAEVEGQRSAAQRPLQPDDNAFSTFTVEAGSGTTATIQVFYKVSDIIAAGFPGFPADARLLLAERGALARLLNQTDSPSSLYEQFRYYDINRVWLQLAERQPSPELRESLAAVEGVERVTYAYDRFQEIQRDPLANALTGMLFAGFWVSLLLSLLDFGFYMAMTIRKRATAFGTLQAIGWSERDLLRLLFTEQVIFVAPALLIGVLIGVLLAYLILPFLGLVGTVLLQIPVVQMLALLVLLVIAFAGILRLTAAILNRTSLNQVMRFGE